MSEELAHHDDQSHYEISLTAGQAFVAFVLLLLSLAASFAFGLMIGKGQADERLVVKREPDVVAEAGVIPSKKKAPADQGRIVELGVADDDFALTETATTAAATETAASETVAPAPTIIEEPTTPPAEAPAAPQPAAAEKPAVPHFAQLLSTGDQKTAESLAAKLIDRGFTSAYVERGANEKGPIYRVRIKFPSEAEARGAEAKLREFSKDVWITR